MLNNTSKENLLERLRKETLADYGFKESEKITAKKVERKLKGKTDFFKAEALCILGFLDEAEKYYKQALDTCDLKDKVEVCFALARFYYFKKKDHLKSIVFFKQTTEIEGGDPIRKAYASLNVGLLLYETDYTNAEIYFQKATDIIEKADILRSIGKLYYKNNDYTKAEIHLKKILDIENCSTRSQSEAYFYLGCLNYKNGKEDEGLAFMKKAAEVGNEKAMLNLIRLDKENGEKLLYELFMQIIEGEQPVMGELFSLILGGIQDSEGEKTLIFD